MAQPTENSFAVPYREKLIGELGVLSYPWEIFFRFVYNALSPLGIEKSFEVINNQTTAKAIDGLQYDFNKVNQIIIEYIVQRITLGPGGVELIETGCVHFVRRPVSGNWAAVKMPGSGPSNSGVTFSMDANGQIHYVSTNITGNKFLSKCTYRARTLSARFTLPTGGFI